MSGKRVLVVDDEYMIRWAIQQTLGVAGYTVAVVGTAAEGIAAWREFRPDIVLLDVRLPDASGLVVLEKIMNEGGKDTAVIMMTAFEESCDAASAKRLGAAAYLSKPFNFENLEVTVRRVLGDRDAA